MLESPLASDSQSPLTNALAGSRPRSAARRPPAPSILRIAGLLLATGFVAATPVPSAADDAACRRSSPSYTLALVELYTSEGCSSCPPADRWLRTLAAGEASGEAYGKLAGKIVPLALHVDYWDELGWPDPFAQHQFSERQRHLAQRAGSGTIYTPEVVAGGRELRGWHDAGRLAQRLREINARPAGADITLSAQLAGDGRRLEISADVRVPAGTRSRPRAILAVYEDNLVSQVRRGENSGVTLRHDRVVRYWSPPRPLTAGSTQTIRLSLPTSDGWQAGNLGVAAIVEEEERGDILQVLSVPACSPPPPTDRPA